MSINERERMALYDKLGQLLGSQQAGWMMELLPPGSWADMATKDDLALTSQELRAEMAELRGEFGELRGEFGELRGEFGELRGELGELRGEMTAGFSSFESTMERRFSEMTRTMVTVMVGFALTVWITLLAGAFLG